MATQASTAEQVVREGWIAACRASAPETPTVHRHRQSAEAEPALAGWTFPVDDLFQ